MLLTTGIRVLQIVLAATCIAMLWSGASALMGSTPVDEVELPPARAATPRDTSFARFGAIAQRDLFGSSQPDDPAEIVELAPDEELPDARLPYALVGTLAMTRAELSLATLEHTSRSDERGAYRIGDRLTEGHRIVGIDKRRIVLEKEGVRSQLRMDEEKDVAAGNGRPSAARSGARKAPDRASADRRRAAARRRAADRQAQQRAAQLREAREAMDDEPEDDEPDGPPPGSERLETLMNGMRMNPVQGEDGQLSGLRIESTDPEGPFAELSQGTVCHEINGFPISQMHMAIQSLSDEEQACMRCTLPDQTETITCF